MTHRQLDRRDFLRLGAAAGATSLLAACGWEGGALVPKLKAVSRLNDWVGEKVFLSSTRLAREYPAAMRTRDFPTYFVSRPGGRNVPPTLDHPEAWGLDVGGEVTAPMRFTMEMLQALPRISYTVKHHCVEGWTAIGTWAGVPLAAVAALVQPTGRARYVRFDTFDAAPRRGGGSVPYYNGWDLKSALHPQTILAYGFNDQPLTPGHGGPLRLYAQIKLGYKLTKYLTKVTFTYERPGGYWEDQGYPWFAGI